MRKMMKNGVLVLCFSLSLLWPGLSFAQSPKEMSSEILQTLDTSLNESEQALMQSLQELATAKELLLASEQELMELTAELDESEAACAELRLELARLKAESAKLSSELARLKATSATLSADLKKAEEALQFTEKQYKQEKKKAEKEKRIWQIIAVALGAFAATR